MSVRTQRKRLLALADSIEAGRDLSEQENQCLVIGLRCLGKGSDANRAFGVAYDRGKGKIKEEKREGYRLMFSWILAAIDKSEYGLGLSVTEALHAAAEIAQRNQSGNFPDVSYETLRRAWYRKEYQYLKHITFTPLDKDSPIEYR